MPELFVATTAGLTGPIAPPVPPVAVSVNVTFTPATGLLLASRTITDGGAPTAVPTVALCEVALFAAIEFAEAEMPDALNVTGAPLNAVDPLAVTVLLFVPAVAPSVHEVSVATPEAFVGTVATLEGLIAPPAPPVAQSVKSTL
jgi:hypothetical protein